VRRLKRRLPASLFGRALLIIVLPVALMQLAVTWAFFEAHWETTTGRLSRGLAGDVAWVAESYEDAPTAANLARVAERAQTLSLSVALQPGRPLPVERRPSLLTVDRAINEALEEALDRPFWFDTTRYPEYVDIRVPTEGGVLRILAPRDRAFAGSAHIFVLWLAGGDAAADHHGGGVHPQPGAGDRAAGGRGGRLRAGGGAALQAARGGGGAQGGAGLHRHAGADRAAHRAADGAAGVGQP
jgi:hypothetical protein